mgnify:CR=1 FL=1
MTARAIGDIMSGLTGAKPTGEAKKVWVGNVRRTFQPVRRNSYNVGEREHTIWKPIGDGSARGGKRFAAAYLSAARNYELRNRKPGKINGPLGFVGLEVLRALLDLVDFRKGTLEPSLDTIMAKVKRSRAAVCSALARLKANGFIDWIRRTEPIEDPEPFGQQVRQASNAYGFDVKRLPREVAGLLKRLVGAGPPPDDATWARTEDATQTEEMYQALPIGEAGSARHPDNPEMAAALNRLGASIAREEAGNASSSDGQNPGEYSTP